MSLGLGLCSVTFRAFTPLEVLKLASRNKIEGIEWGADVHAPVGDLQRAATIAQRSRELGIAVASYGSYVEAGFTKPSTFAPVIETAVALGAPNIRVWAGRRGVASRDARLRARARAAADLRTFAERADEAGIDVALEFHRETLTDTLASTLELLDAVGHPALRTYWQPRAGIALPEALDELTALRPRLSHLHIFNWSAHRERLALAEAEHFWAPILDQVAQWNDPGLALRWAMLEFVRDDDPVNFEQDARTLHSWLSAQPARC